MRKDKKGQAAMEFLMTYGWAILAAIVVIGILGYFYFSEDVLSPRSGVVQQPFYLVAHNADTAGINLEIRNNGGERYNITNISIPDCGYYDTSTPLESGEVEVFAIPCALTQGDRVSGDIRLTYTRQGSSLEQIATGSVRDIVN